jgi:hypothetical protein
LKALSVFLFDHGAFLEEQGSFLREIMDLSDVRSWGSNTALSMYDTHSARDHTLLYTIEDEWYPALFVRSFLISTTSRRAATQSRATNTTHARPNHTAL